jgi:hypothetical protein
MVSLGVWDYMNLSFSNDEVTCKYSIGYLRLDGAWEVAVHSLELESNRTWLVVYLLGKFHKTTDSLARLKTYNFKDLYRKTTNLVYPHRKTIGYRNYVTNYCEGIVLQNYR